MFERTAMLELVVTMKIKAPGKDHLQGIKDTVSLAVEHLQNELTQEGLVIAEGAWTVKDAA